MLKIIKENRRLRKENAELRKAIEETLRELNDAGFANKSILIMSASIRLERALEKSNGGRIMNDKDQVCIWIIRFADYTLASCLGTYQQAMEKAEKIKDLYGGSYTIA